MSFRLVPKSVSLNDPKRRSGRYFASLHRIRQLFGPITSKSLKIDLHSLLQKCSPRNLVLAIISFMATFVEITENKCIIDKHVRDIDTLRHSLWGPGSTYQNAFCTVW